MTPSWGGQGERLLRDGRASWSVLASKQASLNWAAGSAWLITELALGAQTTRIIKILIISSCSLNGLRGMDYCLVNCRRCAFAGKSRFERRKDGRKACPPAHDLPKRREEVSSWTQILYIFNGVYCRRKVSLERSIKFQALKGIPRF